jgi:para-aminobenzoate synthetase component I
MTIYPYGDVVHVPSVTTCDRLWERSRLEWRVGDRGDPAILVAEFLDSYGLDPLSSTQPVTQSDHSITDICGATLLVSAAAAAVMAGASGSTGRPSPAPAVPDLVVVVYAHGAPATGTVGPAAVGEWRLGEWNPSWSTAEHADAVRAVRSAIARGDVYQVNVVGHASAPYLGDPLPALRRVAALPGARYTGVVRGDGYALACASPETLVRVRARTPDTGPTVETRPIKGTRPATPSGRRELLASPKERAEHVMIVDLSRNDLARVARIGTVTVPELFRLRRWCDLWQAESRVTAELADGVDLATLLRAICPGGSVTGAPKLAALAQLAALEPVGRGPSMGALGWVDGAGLDLGLTIRTVAADGDRLHLWAGGGITWDSDPDDEVAEAAAKAAPLRAALAATPSCPPRGPDLG